MMKVHVNYSHKADMHTWLLQYLHVLAAWSFLTCNLTSMRAAVEGNQLIQRVNVPTTVRKTGNIKCNKSINQSTLCGFASCDGIYADFPFLGITFLFWALTNWTVAKHWLLNCIINQKRKRLERKKKKPAEYDEAEYKHSTVDIGFLWNVKDN